MDEIETAMEEGSTEAKRQKEEGAVEAKWQKEEAAEAKRQMEARAVAENEKLRRDLDAEFTPRIYQLEVVTRVLTDRSGKDTEHIVFISVLSFLSRSFNGGKPSVREGGQEVSSNSARKRKASVEPEGSPTSKPAQAEINSLLIATRSGKAPRPFFRSIPPGDERSLSGTDMYDYRCSTDPRYRSAFSGLGGIVAYADIAARNPEAHISDPCALIERSFHVHRIGIHPVTVETLGKQITPRTDLVKVLLAHFGRAQATEYIKTIRDQEEGLPIPKEQLEFFASFLDLSKLGKAA